jgi:hypothetical protein
VGRLHLIELEDQTWCPAPVRDGITDYLQFFEDIGNVYRPVVPLLQRALRKTESKQVIDLCAGGGGPWRRLAGILCEKEEGLTICLTDKYPNPSAFLELQRALPQTIRFHSDPVDATAVADELIGFRTLFSALHHFRPAAAQSVLRDAMEKKQGIGVFELTQRHPIALLFACFAPLLVLLFTPFIRPFRLSRLVWTYLVPLIPLAAMFDGVVSCLRTYSPRELRRLVDALPDSAFQWEIGHKRFGRLPVGITYLLGYPAEGESPPTTGS